MHRTSLAPDQILEAADAYFHTIGLHTTSVEPRARRFAGGLGTMRLAVKMDGGHYTVVEAHTDQIGESRLDKNVKRFFVALHRQADPRHRSEAAY